MADSPTIFVKTNVSRLDSLMSGLDAKGLRAATNRSIKRTLVSGRAAAVIEMRSKRLLSMKSSTMKTRITKHDHASPSRAVNDQFGEIRFSGKPESLARFQAKRRVVGKSKLTGTSLYTVTVNSMGQPYLVGAKAFMVQKGAGADKIILARVGRERLPVEKQFGPSIADVAEKTNAIPIITQRIAIAFDKEMQNNIKFYAERAIKKANATK